MTEQLSYCASLVRTGDHDRFLCALFAPAAAREHLFALYAFNLELARIREQVSEPMLGEIRLQWWRESVDAIYAGHAVRAHPVLRALQEAIADCALPRAGLDALLDARAHDFADAPFAHLSALEEYADASAAGLMRLSLHILGGALPYEGVRRAGIACGLSGIARSAGFHAARGQIFLPMDMVQAEGVSANEILSQKNNAGLHGVIMQLCAAAEAHLAGARQALGKIPQQQLPAVLPAALAGTYLKQMRRPDYDPLHVPQPMPAYRRQMRLLWAALRHRL